MDPKTATVQAQLRRRSLSLEDKKDELEQERLQPVTSSDSNDSWFGVSASNLNLQYRERTAMQSISQQRVIVAPRKKINLKKKIGMTTTWTSSNTSNFHIVKDQIFATIEKKTEKDKEIKEIRIDTSIISEDNRENYCKLEREIKIKISINFTIKDILNILFTRILLEHLITDYLSSYTLSIIEKSTTNNFIFTDVTKTLKFYMQNDDLSDILFILIPIPKLALELVKIKIPGSQQIIFPLIFALK